MSLKLSETLSLPAEAATQTFLIVGKRGSGKTSTTVRLVEQLHRAKVPFVILDPVDVWWGLKAAGTGPGLSNVYVFGGQHQDLPLEAGAGVTLAEFVCEHRASCILACKDMSGLARSTLMTAFITTLYQKWESGPLHVVLEEAHELAPQSIGLRGEKTEAMLGAFKRLWKLGRAQGIGGSAVTQRPASLHKDITTQAEVLVVHKTLGPQDVEAVRQWIKYHQGGEDILPKLSGLQRGEAFVWAPEFPEDKPIGLKRVQMLPRETYDSSATPVAGRVVAPGPLTPVDLEALRGKITAVVERAKENDPRELKAERNRLEGRIRQLEQELQALGARAAFEATRVVVGADLRAFRAVVAEFERWVVGVEGDQAYIVNDLAVLRDTIEARLCAQVGALHGMKEALAKFASVVPSGSPMPPAPAARLPTSSTANAQFEERVGPWMKEQREKASAMGSGERKVLTALAQHAPRGVMQKRRLAILTGYSHGGGRFNNILGALRSAGHVAGSRDLAITQEGLAALGPYDKLPMGRALLEHWMAELGEGERRILEELARHRVPIPKVEVARAVGYEAGGGRFNNILGMLRTLGLIEGRGDLRLADDLV